MATDAAGEAALAVFVNIERKAPASADGMMSSLWWIRVSMSCGARHMPISAEATVPAMPATVAWAAAAGPTARGPISGARNPNTPANVSAAEERIDLTIAA